MLREPVRRQTLTSRRTTRQGKSAIRIEQQDGSYLVLKHACSDGQQEQPNRHKDTLDDRWRGCMALSSSISRLAVVDDSLKPHKQGESNLNAHLPWTPVDPSAGMCLGANCKITENSWQRDLCQTSEHFEETCTGASAEILISQGIQTNLQTRTERRTVHSRTTVKVSAQIPIH